MKKLLTIFLVLFCVLTIFAQPVHLVIFHINDTHAHVWGTNKGGGFARISYIVNQTRKEVYNEGGHVLFLHAGDANTGIPESDQLKAVPDFLILNYMGLDTMTLGNHEFDNPLEIIKMQQKIGKFPFVAANVIDEKNGGPIFEPYIIKDYGNLRVGIIGLATEQTTVLEPLHLSKDGIVFYNSKETLEKYLPIVREKADVVVVLSHLGYYPHGKTILPVEYTTSNELAQAVDGIDVIIDGHTHTKLDPPVVINDVIIAQAGGNSQYLGRIDLWVDEGVIINWKGSLIPITADIPEDPFIKMFADMFYQLGGQALNEVIGETKVFLQKNSFEGDLGRLIADSMVWKSGADFALMNSGGIRAPIDPGEITYRDVLTVLPFGNTLYILELTGEDILELLNYAVVTGGGGTPVFAGLTVEVKDEKPVEVKINGEKLDLNKTYKMVTNNYLASGGDGYIMLKGKPGYDTGFTDADALAEYIMYLGTIEQYPHEKNIINID